MSTKVTAIKKRVRNWCKINKLTPTKFSELFDKHGYTIYVWVRFDDRKISDAILEVVMEKCGITFMENQDD